MDNHLKRNTFSEKEGIKGSKNIGELVSKAIEKVPKMVAFGHNISPYPDFSFRRLKGEKRPYFKGGRREFKTPIAIEGGREKWINPFLQFIIFVPLLRRRFGEKFFLFLEFLKIYLENISEGKKICEASSDEFYYALSKYYKMDDQNVDLFFILKDINKGDFPCGIFDGGSDKLYNYLMEKRFPIDLFIGNRKEIPLKIKNGGVLYDLWGFIEKGSSFDGEEEEFFTYLRIDGLWYRCSDSRVEKISLDFPTSLDAKVLYYRKRIVRGSVCS